jgi:hypothetical protein
MFSPLEFLVVGGFGALPAGGFLFRFRLTPNQA